MTLIEVLVSLLILTACMGLVASVAVQVGKVLSKVQQGSSLNITSFLLHHQVLDDALQRAIVGRNRQQGTFKGSPTELSLQTDAHPLMPDVQNAVFKLSISNRKQSDSELILDGLPTPMRILINPSELAFIYFDESMQPHGQWPPLGVERPAKLPRVIRIEDADKRVLSQWVLLGPKNAHPSLGVDAGSFAGDSQ